MRPRELQELLAVLIPHRLSCLITGAPGVGKSDIVAQAAGKAKADIIVMHPVVSDPTDFKGLPGIVNGQAEFLPYGDLRQLVEAERPTVAFLDDLGQAPAVVQAAAMQLLLARRVNGHAVSDQVTFVAATNRREDRAGVTGILEPVKSRFATIVELEPSLDDWCDWALANDMPPELLAFVRFRPALLNDSGKPTSAIVNRHCPRTVAHAGRLMRAGLTSHEVLAGAAGEGFATELVAFLRVWRELPNIDGILLNPATAQVPDGKQPAVLFAVAAALADRLTENNAGRVITYASRLPREFAVMCVRDGLRRCPEGANNPEFQTWAIENQDLLN